MALGLLRSRPLHTSLRSVRNAVMGSPAIYSTALINELLELEKVDRHWEIAFRRRYLAGKEDDLRSIERSLKFWVTQWELGAVLIGAFILQCLYGLLTFSPLAVVIAIFAVCCLLQLRMHRDKLTLHYTFVALGAYIILMTNLIIVYPDQRVIYGGLTAIFGAAFIHLIVLMVLGRHSVDQNVERFADSCLQFRVPSLLEVQSMVIGLIIFLGICFTTVKLHYLSYTAVVTVIFTIFSRIKFGIRDEEYGENSSNFFEASLPVVRCLISVMFTAAALCVCIASLFGNHVMSVTTQESFKAWERENALEGEYTFAFQALVYLLSAACAIILIINVMLLFQKMLDSPYLAHALEHATLFMGKACLGHRGDMRYEYYAYTLDRQGRVMSVETIRKSPLMGYNRSNMTCYDVYLSMQRRALHALNQRSLYCLVPISRLYSTKRDSSALVRGRLHLERLAEQLDALVVAERKRRHEERRERERLRRLKEAMENRPSFTSTSIPAGVGLQLPPILHDSFREASDDVRSRKRSMSIPADLTLGNVDEIPAVSRHLERLYERRCVTTAITDDFYLRRRGIIDRVRSSWLEATPESLPSFHMLKPTNTCVNRDPKRGDFNFDKIDHTLSKIFRGLEIMNADEPLTGPSPISTPIIQQYGDAMHDDGLKHIDVDNNVLDIDHELVTYDLCAADYEYEEHLPVTIDIGEDTPLGMDIVPQESEVVRIDLTEERSRGPATPVADIEMQSPGSISVAMDAHSPVQYIDLGSTKNAFYSPDISNHPAKIAGEATPANSLGKWYWLDNAVDNALGDRAIPYTETQRQVSEDDAAQHRMRPIEEVLEGEYYINEKGQLVVKNDSRYVPVRYRGVRNVRNLAKYFDNGRQQMAGDDTGARSSDSDDTTPRGRDLAQVVDSPVHKMMMMVNTAANNVIPDVTSRSCGSMRILIPESMELGVSPTKVSKPFETNSLMSFGDQLPLARPNVVLTREYEVYKPFDLNNITKEMSVQPQLVANAGPTVAVEQPSESGTGDVVPAVEPSEETTHREHSVGNSDVSTDTINHMSPRTLRRLAVARHLPLALDSRHEKVFSVCPQPRRDGSVVSLAQTKKSDYFIPVATPSSKPRHAKFDGSSGCDYGNQYLYSAVESVPSPKSSRATRSAATTPNRLITPRQSWKNEFDFSPIAVHSGMDVLLELMQDMVIEDSAVDDRDSEVSHDFIFGR
ncbi:uncharacterized protein BXIN_0430 [Babesia sp. Xinjiang]|uniref:uncharacterized protein n=1 Tax=Babesia sp. Xinjiang TaxID=462227 RepID=UPI000A243002|nr:uncharacterized protein BXIN_0430 [Babesia sp. Xinjiang]ORM41039.1 hypothetical protein BXIN_0430 [Babesia sp. Xinjiang]